MKSQNTVAIPEKALVYKNNYVYFNIVRNYDPEVQYATYGRKCIGKKVADKLMVPNKNYAFLFRKDELPEPPERSDVLSIGMYSIIQKVCADFNVDEALSVFDDDTVYLIKDLASYMIIMSSAAFQHFESYGFSHPLWSERAYSDSYISGWLKEDISVTQIVECVDLWASMHIGEGRCLVCYDSTNINSVAEGISLVERGHAKDDPTKPQINIDYVVKQSDGVPLLYKSFPGSIVDITEASDMIQIIKKLGYTEITAICDRGYISVENVRAFDAAGIDFLLMVKSNLTCFKSMVRRYGLVIRMRSSHYLPDTDQYGITVHDYLFEEGPKRYFHLIWDQKKGENGRRSIMKTVARYESILEKKKTDGSPVSEKQEKQFAAYFTLQFEEGSRRLASYKRNPTAIDLAVNYEGFILLVGSRKQTCAEALDDYSKRDCVEKDFRALKSELGMDPIGTQLDETTDSKIFISFIAGIIRALVLNGTRKLRIKDRKQYTVPAIIKEMEKVQAIRDYKTSKYERRYRLTAKQKAVTSAFALSESDIDEIASFL